LSTLYRLTAAVLILFGAASSAWAQGQGARVILTQGDVLANGAALAVGQAVPAAATVVTGANGRVQLRMDDGTFLALPPASQVALPRAEPRLLVFVRGGLRLAASADRLWRVDMPQRFIRTNGFLRLQDCTAACAEGASLLGQVSQGEAVLEYQGGRVLMRSRAFRWPSAGERPEVLARAPVQLDDTSSQAAASRVRTESGRLLKAGIDAYSESRDEDATKAFLAARDIAPGETIVPYYLGLIALRREDTAAAVSLLQQYTREDPDGAAARDVAKTLTLLSSAQLRQEVQAVVAREKDSAAAPPEPGSIAVQAFVNQGSEAYRAMAKGLAAMIIADLSKVPGLKVLEREKVQLLINEAKLGDSGLADKDSAVRSGRLMRAEKVVVGNFEVQ
jgi:hypothetical protein